MMEQTLGRMATRPQSKRADLASGIGAGLLGGGLGALVAQYVSVAAVAVPFVVIGVILHAWGMLERHRLDAAAPRMWWAEILIWGCWATLVVLVAFLLIRGW